MKNLKKTLLFTSMFVAASAQAEITLNGFASIVAGTTTSSDEALYGFENDFDFSQGSLLALQASSDLGEGFSVTAQILSRGAEDWDTNFEWAYVAYEANDNLRILAGRQRVPFYMFSDFLDVSYAYAWITPPTGVYDLVFDTFDGLGAIYNTSVGEFDTTLHLVYGGNNSELAIGEGSDAEFKNLAGAALTVTRDWLTLRAAYLQTELNVPVDALVPLINGWRSTPFPGVADDLETSKDIGSFIELGFQLDFENIIVVGEFTQLTLDDMPFSDDDSFYVMAGYRFDNMLAHITYGEDENSKDRITDGVPVGVGLDALIDPTNAFTDSQISESNYVTLGLRWDFHDSAALKFEYTSYSDDLNSNNDAGLFRTALVTVF
ncbi:hypothetical protein A9Q74_03395 [Colwellia sp. 39_35_sub15_T18]|nr:hypothetical protein A9Q74_03395 [Colwellia sp. 39_35_sub15_T18]